MLSTFVIVALQDSRKVFSFLLTNWLRIPWFFSRGLTRLAFSFFLTYNFFFFPRAVIRDTLISCSWGGFFVFFFFLVPWMLVDIRLVNIYIYIYKFFQLMRPKVYLPRLKCKINETLIFFRVVLLTFSILISTSFWFVRNLLKCLFSYVVNMLSNFLKNAPTSNIIPLRGLFSLGNYKHSHRVRCSA